MMQLVVSCDYLISPAFCEAEIFASKIGDLVAIKREMEGRTGKVLIERDSLSKLRELNYYPCAPLFNHNIPRELREEFSAKDIAKVIHNITSMSLEDNFFASDCVAEWSAKVFSPTVNGSSHMRQRPLEELLEDVFLANYLCSRSLSVLHHPLATDVVSVSITGDISECVPSAGSLPVLALEEHISIFSEFNKFLSNFNAKELYESAVTEAQICEAFSIGAADVVRRNGFGSVRKYDLGEDFLASLDAHQCGPGQRYSGTAFEVICHVIATVPKSPHKPMYSDMDKEIQEAKGDALGWRTHITTGNPALRLMFWTDDKKVTLANVGNKKALEII